MFIHTKILFTGAAALATIAMLSFTPREVVAQEKMLSEGSKQAERQTLRNATPNKGRFVPLNSQFKVKGPGGTGIACCTGFNSSEGGIGCATFQDSCPSGTFVYPDPR